VTQKYELVGLTYEEARSIVDDRWSGLITNGHAWLDADTLMRPEGCQCDQCKLRDQRVNRPAQETVSVPVLPISAEDEATVDALVARRADECMAKVRQHFAERRQVQTFMRVGPEQGMSSMCECGQTFAKHIAQDNAGNSSVCPTANR